MVPLKKEVVMKSIEIDDDLYAFIASQTKHIGESASQILRRLLLPEDGAVSHGVQHGGFIYICKNKRTKKYRRCRNRR